MIEKSDLKKEQQRGSRKSITFANAFFTLDLKFQQRTRSFF